MAQGRSTKVISMIEWTRPSRLSIKKSPSLRRLCQQPHGGADPFIKSLLASRNDFHGQTWCKLGHDTFKTLNEDSAAIFAKFEGPQTLVSLNLRLLDLFELVTRANEGFEAFVLHRVVPGISFKGRERQPSILICGLGWYHTVENDSVIKGQLASRN
jgi:hypothetical protein